MKHFTPLLLLAVAVALSAAELPAALRGQWTAHAYSDDKGATLRELPAPGRAYAVASADAVALAGVGVSSVVAVVAVDDAKGNPGHVVPLDCGLVLAVTPQPPHGVLVLVQVYAKDDATGELGEVSRALVTVER